MRKIPIYILILALLFTVAGCKSDTTPAPVRHNPPGNTDSSTWQPPAASEPESKTKVVPNESKEKTAPANNKSYSWYTNPNKEHQVPYVDQAIKDLLAENNAFYVLPDDSKIYLTFDCGYELGYTGKILDILKANQVKATFFITGHYLQTQPELAKRMKAEGHLVGNHTMTHPDCSLLSADKIEQEIIPLAEKFKALTGYEMDKYLRPPMGNYSTASLAAVKELGYTTVFWSMALKDWDPNKQPGAEYSYQYVINNIHPGAVVLLHVVSKSDTEALDKMIKDLQGQGYTLAAF